MTVSGSEGRDDAKVVGCLNCPGSSVSSFECSLKQVASITGRTFMRSIRSTQRSLLGGELPTAQRRLVEAWVEIHREELQHDWELLQTGQPPVKIEPLR